MHVYPGMGHLGHRPGALYRNKHAIAPKLFNSLDTNFIFNFSSLTIIALIRRHLILVCYNFPNWNALKNNYNLNQIKYLFNNYLEEILADQIYEWSRPGSIVIHFLTRMMPYYCRCQPPSSDWQAVLPRPHRCRWRRGWVTACWPQRCRWSCCCCPRDLRCRRR